MTLRLVQGTHQVVKKSNYNIKLCQWPDLDKSDVVESEFVFPTDDIFEEDFDHFVRQSVLQHLHHASPELVRSRLQPKHFEHDLVFTWVRGSTVSQISAARYVKIIDLPAGKINDPSSGVYFSLLFLPATSSSLSRTLSFLS